MKREGLTPLRHPAPSRAEERERGGAGSRTGQQSLRAGQLTHAGPLSPWKTTAEQPLPGGH